MNPIIEKYKDTLVSICKKLQIKSMYLFGSATGTGFSDSSDLDFLIDFEDTLSIEDYTDNYFILQYKLRALFNKEIDLITERSLQNPYLIKTINKNKQLIYES